MGRSWKEVLKSTGSRGAEGLTDWKASTTTTEAKSGSSRVEIANKSFVWLEFKDAEEQRSRHVKDFQEAT
ncbi:hypothetical protein KFK09_000556 [Dendrobium nobile]|uniref:Uncharacterized protein n=1 Tax=Dendrobium nobile TaxID=94219 RepID=A0A8T3CDG4_DENNO|nr:hypothetical protein KFK09_000556 [Dendrobium nobile]